MPTATFPTWGKTTKPEPTFPTFPTWGKQPATPTDTFDTQVEVFNEHLQEFYHQDRGNQTYLDFLGKTYPQDAGQLTPDFITAINQTQPEFLGTQADYLKAHPVEQTLLDKLKGFGVGVLNTAIKGLEYGVWPFTAFGIALHEYDKELEAAKAAGEPTPPLQMPATLEEFKEWFPGGKTYEEYQKLSFGRQLFYEAPAWATTLLLPSATSLRATLAGTAGAGGVKGAVATVGGIALKPLAGYEAIIGKITGGITNKIISVAQQRAIRTALRKGAARAGIDLTTEAENALILAYRTSLEQHINSELVAWMARNAGIELSDKVQEKVINYLLTHASPEWSAGKMLDALEGVISGRLITASAEKTATATARMVPIALSQSIAPTTTTGITEWGAVTGAVAGVQLNPITTPVGKGYEIIQNGQPVGEISYNPNFPGVEGIVIDRIDIVETARRQGLATQAIDKVLTEAETQGVPLYTGMLEPDGVKLMNALEQRGIVSLTPAPQRMLGNEITRGVPQYAPTTAMAEGETVSGEEVTEIERATEGLTRYGILQEGNDVYITESVAEIPSNTTPKKLYKLSLDEAREFNRLETLSPRQRRNGQIALIERILARGKMLGRGGVIPEAVKPTAPAEVTSVDLSTGDLVTYEVPPTTPPPLTPVENALGRSDNESNGFMKDLQDAQTALDANNQNDLVKKWVNAFPKLRGLWRLINPNAVANKPAEQAIKIRHILYHEADGKTKGVMSYLNELGSREEIFGKIDDSGVFLEGLLKGESLGDIAQQRSKWNSKLTDMQKLWLDRAKIIEDATVEYLQRNDIDIK